MKYSIFFFFYMLALVLIFAFLFTSCTFHFKATDIEAEGTTNLTYELKSIGILQTDQANSGKDGLSRFVTF